VSWGLLDLYYGVHRLVLAPGSTYVGVKVCGPTSERVGKFRQAALCIRKLVANEYMRCREDPNENLLGFFEFGGFG
jgi:hypothetical protein